MPDPRAEARARDGVRVRSRPALILLAFAIVYFVWGSTFLAIRIAITTLPPLLMCAMRLTSAGAILLVAAKATGAPWPRGVQWRNAAVVGLMLPAIGNGTVTIGEGHVPSGLVALLASTIPLWMALLPIFERRSAGCPPSAAPAPRAWAGLALGFAGVALLLGPGLLGARSAEISPGWALIPLVGAFSWAWGSLWSRRATMPASPIVSTGIGLTVGGLALFVLSAGVGEWARFDVARVTPAAWAALAYLSVFGSVIAFTAYLFLLRNVAPSIVSTYALVNPIVALALGWMFAGEALTPRTLLAAAIVIASVILITTAGLGERAAASAAAGPPARPGPEFARER